MFFMSSEKIFFLIIVLFSDLAALSLDEIIRKTNKGGKGGARRGPGGPRRSTGGASNKSGGVRDRPIKKVR